MYNLNRVYACVSLSPERIGLLVCDAARGRLNVLFCQSERNDGLYADSGVSDPYALAETFRAMFAAASAQIGVELTAAQLTLDGVGGAPVVSEFRAPVSAHDGKGSLAAAGNAAFKAHAKQERAAGRRLWPLRWQLLRAVDAQTGRAEAVLRPGRAYTLLAQAYLLASPLAAQARDALRDAGIKPVSASCRSLDFAPYAEDGRAVVADVSADACALTYCAGRGVVAQASLPLGEKSAWSRAAAVPDAEAMSVTQAVQIAEADFGDRADTGPVNVLCEPEADSLIVRGVCADDVRERMRGALAALAGAIAENAVATAARLPEAAPETIYVRARTDALARSLCAALNALGTGAAATPVPKPPRLAGAEFAAGALAISRQADADALLGVPRSCAQPFWSPEFDAEIERRVARMAVTTQITKLAQKLIK